MQRSEHNEKLDETLKEALDVFEEEGFENTTFQKIADRAKITRTSLYQYFKNKLDIFHFGIKIFMKDIENTITELSKESSLSSTEKLIKLMDIIMETLEKNKKLLSVILDFLVNIHKDTDELNYHIRRRTIRLRHIIAGIIIDGIRSGELRQIDIRAAGDMFFALIESVIFELVLFKRTSVRPLFPSFEASIRLLSNTPPCPPNPVPKDGGENQGS
ncbi:MAG: TetR/AcrR family transcriptional regulator [Spirochaetaceae bacterium]|jgi:AcrR family transcriptional regulator|nr:TetR/AcrR family transcriptional regulator [Spirochaetaceae bacterium]